MAQVSLPYTLTPGQPENVTQLTENLNALVAGINSVNTTQIASSVGNFGAWADWTPQVYQNGNRTSTKISCKYVQIGKLVVAKAHLTITAAGASGYSVKTSLPVTPASSSGDGAAGSFTYVRSGGDRYAGTAVITTFAGEYLGFQVNAANVSLLGQDPTFATANNDVLAFTVSYEV